MFWYLVRLSTGALSGGIYANPLEMAIQSAVACSQAKDDGQLVSWQLMECVLVWVVSSSLAMEDGFLVSESFNYLFSAVSVSSQNCVGVSVCRSSIVSVSCRCRVGVGIGHIDFQLKTKVAQRLVG